MACNEIVQMRNEVMGRLRGTVDHWHTGLQQRYGDPRVYAMQREQMLRQDERVAYDLSRRNGEQFVSTYDQASQRNRDAHEKRMATKSVKAPPARSRKGKRDPAHSAAPASAVSGEPTAVPPAASD